MIVQVPRELATVMWPELEALIKLATDKSDGQYEPEDVLAEVVDGRAHLWCVWNEATSKPDAAITTKIVKHPRKQVCFMHFCGGTNMPEWVEEWTEVVSAWARACDCQSLELNGRVGWTKLIPGVRVLGTSMVKDV